MLLNRKIFITRLKKCMGIVNNKIYKSIKKNQFIYFLKQRICNRDFQANLRKMRKCSKSREQIRREMKLFRNYWGCKPYDYIRYALFDKDLTDDELLDYIPSYYHYNYYTESLYTGIDVDLYGNKLSLYRIFKERGIPTPEVLAVVKNCKLYDLNGNSIQPNNVYDSHDNSLFFKPVLGQGGTGIKVFLSGDLNSFLKSLDKKEIYIVQPRIQQADDFNRINSSSVNTLRVITQSLNGEVKVCVCVMRMGRKGKMVDNSHQGGLSIQIDVADGTFASSATAEHGGGCYTSHPDSGFIFKGSQISNWDSIKSAIIKCASMFPELKEIAWDVAVTKSGIEMIELNLGYGIAHLQCTCGGMRRVLNVYPK